MIEHLHEEAAYRKSAAYIREVADGIGLTFQPA
jgi:hypothetical protein